MYLRGVKDKSCHGVTTALWDGIWIPLGSIVCSFGLLADQISSGPQTFALSRSLCYRCVRDA